MDDSSLGYYNLHPELIKDVMQNLLNTNVIGDKALSFLKQEDVKTFEPAMIMDIRHDQIKQEHRQNQNKQQILEEARRLVQTEESAERERVKEMRTVDREIKRFQKQLETEHKQLIKNFNLQRVSEKKLWTVSSDKNPPLPIIAVRTTRKKSCNLKNMKNSDFYQEEYLDVKTIKVEEIHHHKEFECDDGNQKFIEVSIKKVENVNDPSNEEGLDIGKEISTDTCNGAEYSENKTVQTCIDEGNDDKEYRIMNMVWIKWMKFVRCRRVDLSEKMKQGIHRQTDVSEDRLVFEQDEETNSRNPGEENEKSFNENEKSFNKNKKFFDGNEKSFNENEESFNENEKSLNENEESFNGNEKSLNKNDADEFYGNCCDNYKNEYYQKNYQNQRNLSILKKYFKKWKYWVPQMKELSVLKVEKQKREEKIKKYIEIIQSKKNSANEIKSSPSLERYSHTSASDFSDSSSKSFKTSSISSSYGAKYKHRFEAQKNIIAMQKSKLEDQSKVIEDLKSFQLKLEAEMSQRESSKTLKATLQNFDPRLKSKAALVQRALSSDSGYKSLDPLSEGSSEALDDPSKQMSSKTKSLSLEIVQRMEKRNEERKKKWLAAQERRKQFEEEKLLKLKAEEEMRHKRELDAKQRKIDELKEKQILEKLREEERIRERETYQRNCQIADESNRRRLLMKGLKKLRYNVLVTKRDVFIASDHYKTRLKQKYLRFWRDNIKQAAADKMNMATQFYYRRMVQKTFHCLFDMYRDYIQKQQAADDMYDMKIQSKYFSKWYDFTCAAYLATQDKLKIAAKFYNRRILRSNFNQWRKLPRIMFQERSREQRLRVLRERVQELLPDYRPVPLDDED